jgi:hypothetical protein
MWDSVVFLAVLDFFIFSLGIQVLVFRRCHPERSEGPAFRGEQQVLRFAQDDNLNG